ncbi:MAG: hypothetical protein IT256_08820 [Chitinophagaceae bacterium]|nr:hypothetical protein [Chitinophagaceae bacterium]
MQYRSVIVMGVLALLVILGVSACRKTIVVGNKPLIEFVSGTDYLTMDSTLIKDKRYMFKVKTDRAEDLSNNTTFEVVRTYSGTADTTVYYSELKGEEQVTYSYLHTFTTLMKAGTERFTVTVKNEHGIVNQKILIFTVK